MAIFWTACPGTIAQAEALEEKGIHFDAVLSIEISDEEIVERMGGRRACTGLRRHLSCGVRAPQG